MNSHLQPSPIEVRPGWRHAVFPDSVRFVLAPLALCFTGFFTANILINGSYSWLRTSQTMALTLTVLILSREFVYKEQRSRGLASNRAWRVVLYSCVFPYLVGLMVMVALWVFS